MPAYLDHAATTPMRPKALAAMEPFLGEHFGNPSSTHSLGRRARQAVDDARDVVAATCGARPGEVVFTGSGTESDNLAILGSVADGIAVCSAGEHHAVLHTVASLGDRGRVVPIDGRGVIDLDALADALDDRVTVVSVMLVNNETGVVQPLDEVVATVRRRAPRAWVHTDAVQAFPWLDVAVVARDADLISLSAHKLGGPKGVGALIVRDGVRLAPQIHGGGQERERRSGTTNVAGVVGMAAAMDLTYATRPATVARVARLRDRLARELLKVPRVVETGERSMKVAGNLHLRFAGLDAEALLFLLDETGVCASAGSACASGALEPSHVLEAMGLSDLASSASIRFSLGHTTTDDEIDLAIKATIDAVAHLRRPAGG